MAIPFHRRGIDRRKIRSRRGLDTRNVRPADLLNRRVISLDTSSIARSIEDKVVVVTGAGGTIGGELARQVLRYKPKKLILLENNATALFYCESELRARRTPAQIEAVLGDIRDRGLVDQILRENRPHTLFHAAAHKHVHQLETNVYEGVSNNLLGTYHLALAAERHGVETFLFISTDKAVRPRCVMGATKRAAEITLLNLARASKTRYVAVRFGNVLGSSGSVLKIFQEQIEKGLPLTITHPEAARYFMTVEEAVGLVLQTSLLAGSGDICMLKMGSPVRIIDLAHRLIRMSGLVPDRDVKIRVTGLKPGEKVAEELIEELKELHQSEHPDIMIVRSEDGLVRDLKERLARLETMSLGCWAKADVIGALARLVPTYVPDPVHGLAQNC